MKTQILPLLRLEAERARGQGVRRVIFPIKLEALVQEITKSLSFPLQDKKIHGDIWSLQGQSLQRFFQYFATRPSGSPEELCQLLSDAPEGADLSHRTDLDGNLVKRRFVKIGQRWSLCRTFSERQRQIDALSVALRPCSIEKIARKLGTTPDEAFLQAFWEAHADLSAHRQTVRRVALGRFAALRAQEATA